MNLGGAAYKGRALFLLHASPDMSQSFKLR